MIDDVIARWHRYLGGELPGGLDQLLSDDVVFFSPVVYTPQRGKRLAMQYLEAASRALAGEVAADGAGGAGGAGGAFQYTKQVLAGDTAVLEFETSVDGKYVNGGRHHPLRRRRPDRRIPRHDAAPPGDPGRARADGPTSGCWHLTGRCNCQSHEQGRRRAPRMSDGYG